jgi:glyoxylase-like metal-dependent hydrolase (beta-lactamase superfamily II)
MLKIEMLPARHGDCLWIEYGDAKKPYRMLIDAGPTSAYKHVRERILALPENKRHFELFIVTHIDADHIEGAVKLLRDRKLKATYGDVWFNGYRHLKRSRTLGGPLGEYLTAAIVEEGLPWNEAFGGDSVVVPEEGKLPVHKLRGGMTLTLLSPTWERLEKLRPQWEAEVRAAGLVKGSVKAAAKKWAGIKRLHPTLGLPSVAKLAAADPSGSDGAVANGSSIAVLAEYDKRRCIFAGDAFPDVLLASLRRLLKKPSEKMELDVFKLPHHGSRANVSPELIDRVKSALYLFSSSGAIFKHPDREAVARVIHHDKTSPLLCFNYKTTFNEMWANPNLISKHKYRVKYPPPGKEGLLVEIQ